MLIKLEFSQPSTQAFPSRLLDLAQNFMTSPNDTERYQVLMCTSRSRERERERLGMRLEFSISLVVMKAHQKQSIRLLIAVMAHKRLC